MCSAAKILNFSCPTYHTGKCAYVDFYCEDPASGSMRRKRYKLDHIKSNRERKHYAQMLISTLLQRLVSGWSPWTKEVEMVQTRYAFKEVVEHYRKSVVHAGETGELRFDSVKSYKSYLKVFAEYCEVELGMQYIDEITTGKLQSFLDYIVYDLSRSARTHNNYLVWLGVFCRWLKKHEYIKELPTKDLTSKTETKEKNRITLSDKQLDQLRAYCEQNNKHYLLVCYLLYYCMIRPKELSMLTIGNIHLHDGVIHIPGDVSKNRKGANVTLPTKVIHLMLDLQIFNYPSHYYLFSQGFAPGKNFCKSKPMSDYWGYHIRRDLKFGMELKLYSLKDTGITNLLHKVDVLTVRDQARHSDISITNIYAERQQNAVASIQKWDETQHFDKINRNSPES